MGKKQGNWTGSKVRGKAFEDFERVGDQKSEMIIAEDRQRDGEERVPKAS